MGLAVVYTRKVKTSKCHNNVGGSESTISHSNCPCTDLDFECANGFEMQRSDRTCQLVNLKKALAAGGLKRTMSSQSQIVDMLKLYSKPSLLLDTCAKYKAASELVAMSGKQKTSGNSCTDTQSQQKRVFLCNRQMQHKWRLALGALLIVFTVSLAVLACLWCWRWLGRRSLDEQQVVYSKLGDNELNDTEFGLNDDF